MDFFDVTFFFFFFTNASSGHILTSDQLKINSNSSTTRFQRSHHSAKNWGKNVICTNLIDNNETMYFILVI